VRGDRCTVWIVDEHGTDVRIPQVVAATELSVGVFANWAEFFPGEPPTLRCDRGAWALGTDGDLLVLAVPLGHGHSERVWLVLDQGDEQLES
jgi:hypothetical protein